jgi:hypothetical protein
MVEAKGNYGKANSTKNPDITSHTLSSLFIPDVPFLVIDAFEFPGSADLGTSLILLTL